MRNTDAVCTAFAVIMVFIILLPNVTVITRISTMVYCFLLCWCMCTHSREIWAMCAQAAVCILAGLILVPLTCIVVIVCILVSVVFTIITCYVFVWWFMRRYDGLARMYALITVCVVVVCCYTAASNMLDAHSSAGISVSVVMVNAQLSWSAEDSGNDHVSFTADIFSYDMKSQDVSLDEEMFLSVYIDGYQNVFPITITHNDIVARSYQVINGSTFYISTVSYDIGTLPRAITTNAHIWAQVALCSRTHADSPHCAFWTNVDVAVNE